MSKVIKILGSILSTILLTLIVVPILLSLLLNLSFVQDYVSGKASQILSKTLETTVNIGTLRLKLFNRVSIDQFYLEDYHGDTLLALNQLVIPLRTFNPFTGEIALGDISLIDPHFNLIQDSTGRTNLTQILAKLKSDKPKEKGGSFALKVGSIAIENMAFRFRKRDVEPHPYGVNFSDIDVSRFDLKGSNVSIIDDSINLSIDRLSIAEKSGFVLNNLTSKHFSISGTGMLFDKLGINTPDSRLSMSYLHFKYDTWSNYSDFIEKVRLDGEIQSSTVSYRTIAFFAPGLKEWQSVYRNVTGTVTGPIAAMSGRLSNVEIGTTKLSASFGIYGLTDIQRTRFTLNIPRLTTNAKDIDFIMRDLTRKPLGKQIETVQRMGEITFSGNFDGMFSNFKADGKLHSKQGNFALSLDIKPLARQNTEFSGQLKANDFNIGELFAVNKLERITLDAKVNGQFGSNGFTVNTETKIPTLTYNDYTYQGIDINGEFRNRNFVGCIASTDTNLSFDFDGTLDFNDSIPKYNFDLKLYQADLHQLHFNSRDTISQLRGNLVAEAQGSNLDNITGQATINNLLYINQIDTVRTGQIRFLATNNSEKKLVGMYSSFADIELRGRLSYERMFSYFQNTLLSYLPSMSSSVKSEPVAQAHSSEAANIDSYYLLSMDVKEANNVAGIFLPGLELAQGTNLSFLFNPESDRFSLQFKSDFIERGNFFVTNLNLNSQNQADSISFYLRSDDLYVSGFEMPNFSVVGSVKNNKIDLATRFNNKEKKVQALLSTRTTLIPGTNSGLPQVQLDFLPSTFTADARTWHIGAKQILMDSLRVNIDNFSIFSGDQRLTIDGIASREVSDTLKVALHNFDLAPFSQISASKGYRFRGMTNGYAYLSSALKQGMLYAQINFDSLQVNDVRIPNTLFESNWDFTNQRAKFTVTDREANETVILGYYRPTDSRFQIDAKLNNIDLSLIDPLLSGVLANTTGSANVDIRVSGDPTHPQLNGTVSVPELTTTVEYTNVPYKIKNAVVKVENSNFTLPTTTVLDPKGNKAMLEMNFTSNHLSNLAYEITVHPNNLLVLNTTAQQNEMFYGSIYASGVATIKGNKRGVAMDIKATTSDNSEFFMPLSSSSDAKEVDFIVFENKVERSAAMPVDPIGRRKMLRERAQARMNDTRTNLDINLTINAKPNTELQLVIDPTVGDIIKGRGNGTINLHINPNKNDFTIYGDYEITEGSYLFTLRNIINKKFIIEPGSTIQWTGDPVDAQLGITAVYKLKASLAPLLSSNDEMYRRRVPVDCIIKLSDRLTQPTITFDVKVLNTDPETESLVTNVLNTQEMMATQFIWLLAVNSFYSDNSGSNQSLNIGTMGGTVTGLEFISNQLSNWLSTDRFSFMPRYNPKSELNSDEVGAAFSYELIKDRLIVEGDGTYDTGNNISMNNNTANRLSGDFYITALLDQAGNFKAKAFTRTIDRFDENQGLQESGLGIYYREGFNTLKDLVDTFKRRFKQIGQKKNKPIEEEENTNENTTTKNE